MLRAVESASLDRSRGERQEVVNELAWKIRRAAQEAVRDSMIPVAFERNGSWTLGRIRRMKREVTDARKKWSEVEGLVAELIAEVEAEAEAKG